MDVLAAWNPLGKNAATVGDLDGYRIEATDILFHFGMSGSRRPAARIVQQVLSEAFELDVSLASCEKPAAELWRIHMGERWLTWHKAPNQQLQLTADRPATYLEVL
jgi:hypothetical protein